MANDSLFRFKEPELRLRHGHKFTAADGISAAATVGGICEDPSGRVWVSSWDTNLPEAVQIADRWRLIRNLSEADDFRF